VGRLFGRRGSGRLWLLATHEVIAERRAGIDGVMMCGAKARICREGDELDMEHEQERLGMGWKAR
jgi:hypothetical protein